MDKFPQYKGDQRKAWKVLLARHFGRYSKLQAAIRNQLKQRRASPGIGWKQCWSWQYGWSWIFDEKIHERWKDECRLLQDDFMSIDTWHKKHGPPIMWIDHPTLGPCISMTLDTHAYTNAKEAHRKTKQEKFIKKYGDLKIKWQK